MIFLTLNKNKRNKRKCDLHLGSQGARGLRAPRDSFFRKARSTRSSRWMLCRPLETKWLLRRQERRPPAHRGLKLLVRDRWRPLCFPKKRARRQKTTTSSTRGSASKGAINSNKRRRINWVWACRKRIYPRSSTTLPAPTSHSSSSKTRKAPSTNPDASPQIAKMTTECATKWNNLQSSGERP